MRSLELNNSEKTLLSAEDIAKFLSIKKSSAKVTAARYVKNGYLIRLKRDLYIPFFKFESLTEEELFGIANLLQTPSYISLTTALSYYDVATQQQNNFIESVALKRTRNFAVRNVEFNFIKVKKEFYSGFELKNLFFIATPEKAFADAVYLTSLNRYNCDFDAIDFRKIEKEKVTRYLTATNDKTKQFWEELCKSYKI